MHGHRQRVRIVLLAQAALLALSSSVALPVPAAVTLAADAEPLAADAEPVALSLPSDAELASDAALATVDVPAPVRGDLDMGLVQRTAMDTVSALAAEDWDLGSLSWWLAGQADPVEAAFDFVRDRIGYEAYPGVLRGAAGTLAARAGNAYDRALLLKALLDGVLVPTRFAFGELEEATAAAVLARTFESPSDPLPVDPMAAMATLDAGALADRARRDNALLRMALGDRLDGLAGPADEAAASDPRRHVWVQALSGSEWVDLDPTLAEAQPGETLTAATSTDAAIPLEDRQTVRLQVMAETLAFGSLDDQVLLDVTLDAADAADSEVFLYFQPALGGIGGSIADALGEAVAYSPELMVDGQVTQGSGFPVFGSTDIFSGNDPLGGGDELQLVSLRLVVTRQAPGYPEDAFVRTIIDRASARDRAAGGLTPESLRPLEVGEAGPTALMPLHHVMISTGGANPRRVALERAQMARFVGENLLDPEEASDFAMSDLLWPVAVVDKALVLASERAIVPSLADAGAVAAYVARPRVYLTSIGPSASGADSFSFVTDLLADDVRLIAPGSEPVADAPARRIWYGAAQTAMETEYVLGIVRGLDPATRSVEAVSLSMGEPLTVIEGGDALEVSVAREALQEAVGSGLVAVVPGSPIAADAWWTIDPASGQTRSILDPGLAAGRGAGNNYVNSSQGNTYYVDEQGNTWVRKAGGGGPPSRCSPGQEYVAIIGCVSVPAAWAIRGTVTVALVIVVGYAATALWQAALGI